MTVTLSACLADVEYRAIFSETAYPAGVADVAVTAVCFDSRMASDGAMFCCFPGQKTDGHDYAAKAYAAGARVFMVERDLSAELPEDAICVLVEETRYAMALAAANFYGNPQKELKVIGITGTKGKTTITYMMEAILHAAGRKVGILGTLGARIGDQFRELDHTTPEAPDTYALLRWMADEGCEFVVMEVSSHALWQHRVLGIHYAAAAMTVMGLDHLGVGGHPSYEHYVASKQLLFKRCDVAVLNADDDYYEAFRDAAQAPEIVSYALVEATDITCSSHPLQTCFTALGARFKLPLPGEVSIRNALCAAKLAAAVGVAPEVAAAGLKTVVIPGRFEVIPTAREDVMFVVDYAHNRVSVEAAIDALRSMNPKRVVCLFGSIGDRMQVRRPELAEASKKADFVVLTSDDPGFEDPQAIADEIEGYLGDMPHVKIVSRWDAVAWIAENAQPGDAVLLAGKGHEYYINIQGKHEPFCEREILQRVAGAPAQN